MEPITPPCRNTSRSRHHDGRCLAGEQKVGDEFYLLERAAERGVEELQEPGKSEERVRRLLPGERHRRDDSKQYTNLFLRYLVGILPLTGTRQSAFIA